MFSVEKETKITCAEFELQVKRFLESTSGQLEEFQTEHRESIQGDDGTYEIDITARFRVFGVKFLVLVECKQHKYRIIRDYVQVLHAKQVSLGAQKAIMFSTYGFNEGAVNYALQHGIALVQLASGKTLYFSKGADSTRLPGSLPDYVGWLLTPYDGASDGVGYSLVDPRHPEALNKFLFESSKS